MLTASVLPNSTLKRIVAFFAALVLTLSVAFAASSNSWTANAAPEEPANVELVADDDLTIAGPSWTWSRAVAPPLPPTDFFGPSWG